MKGKTYLINLEAQQLEHFILYYLDRAIRLNQRAIIPPEIIPREPEQYIDIKRVSELLNVSLVTICDWEKKGILQSYRMGNLKRFKLSEVMSAPEPIKRKRVKSASGQITPDLKEHNGDTIFYSQLDMVYKTFYEKPRTMKEADFACGVMRESICRYVRTLRKQKKIFLLRHRRCERTNYKAGEYTTNPQLFPKTQVQQLSFFD